eukprot:3307150-Ditylum_brightwellii.AAC.2
MMRAICYSFLSVKLRHTTVQLSRFLQCIYQNWNSTTQPIFQAFWEILYGLTRHLPLPDGYLEDDCLCYFIFEHSPDILQKILTNYQADISRSHLLSYPDQHLAPTTSTPLTDSLPDFPLAALHPPESEYYD